MGQCEYDVAEVVVAVVEMAHHRSITRPLRLRERALGRELDPDMASAGMITVAFGGSHRRMSLCVEAAADVHIESTCTILCRPSPVGVPLPLSLNPLTIRILRVYVHATPNIFPYRTRFVTL